MQRFGKSALIGLCISALFLMLSSSAARAQVLAGSGDVSGYGGYGMVNNGGGNHPIFGGSGGFNLVPAATVFGEYNYMSLGSCGSSCTEKAQLFGGGARFNFMTSGKVVPYGVVAFGDFRLSDNAGDSANGYYVGFGGGASCYLGHNWGVRPEYRFDRVELEGNGTNVSVITGGVFFQFGGHGTATRGTTVK